MWAQLFFILSQITRDRQTDGQTDSFLVARPRCMQCMQRSAVKINLKSELGEINLALKMSQPQIVEFF